MGPPQTSLRRSPWSPPHWAISSAAGVPTRTWRLRRPGDAAPGDRHDALDQGPAEQHGIRHGGDGAHVLADDADLGRVAVARHLMPGEDLDELLLAAAGVEGGDDHDLHPVLDVALRPGQAHGLDGLGLVVLDADQALSGPEQVQEDADALEDIAGALAHEQIVAGDVGLALGPVDHQGVDLVVLARVELDAGGEGGPTQTDHAAVADALAQHRGVQGLVVRQGLGELGPGLLTVGLDDHAGGAEPGGVGDRAVLDGDHGPGAGGMDRGADIAPGLGDDLTLEHPVAHLDDGIGGGANVLLDGQDQVLRARCGLHGTRVGQVLLVRHVDAAVELPQPALVKSGLSRLHLV